jgi:hypothetical protein
LSVATGRLRLSSRQCQPTSENNLAERFEYNVIILDPHELFSDPYVAEEKRYGESELGVHF